MEGPLRPGSSAPAGSMPVSSWLALHSQLRESRCICRLSEQTCVPARPSRCGVSTPGPSSQEVQVGAGIGLLYGDSRLCWPVARPASTGEPAARLWASGVVAAVSGLLAAALGSPSATVTSRPCRWHEVSIGGEVESSSLVRCPRASACSHLGTAALEKRCVMTMLLLDVLYRGGRGVP